MRRALLVFTLGCLATAAPVLAQPYPGVALRWNHCFGEGTGLSARSFACDTNAGVEVLVGSFALASEVPNANGNEIVVDLADYPPYYGPYMPVPGPGTPLPEWWKLRQPGTCRQNALSASFTADPENTVCQDWGGGQQVGGIGIYRIEDTLGPGRARIVMAVAVPMTALASLVPGVEYYSFTITIRHDKTVGTGACAGCGSTMYILLNSIKVTTSDPYNAYLLSGPLNGSDASFVTWNQSPVSTRAASWGSLKSLYR